MDKTTFQKITLALFPIFTESIIWITSLCNDIFRISFCSKHFLCQGVLLLLHIIGILFRTYNVSAYLGTKYNSYSSQCYVGSLLIMYSSKSTNAKRMCLHIVNFDNDINSMLKKTERFDLL